MERLVGALSESEWNKLTEDTQLKILELVTDDKGNVLNMSSVNKKSREQLAEAR